MTDWTTITPVLSQRLAELERRLGRSGVREEDLPVLRAAIADAITFAGERADESAADLTPEFILAIHRRLAGPLHAAGIGEFAPGTGDQSWSGFRATVESAVDEYGAEAVDDVSAWTLAQLFWGGHLASLQLSTAWVLVNALRHRYCAPPLLPDPRHEDALRDRLEDAGPDLYDAEGLRALLPRLVLP